MIDSSYTYKAPNRFEEKARAVKVAGIIRALEEFGRYRKEPVTARELLGWNETSWQLIAHAARVTLPSPTTRSAIIGELAGREVIR